MLWIGLHSVLYSFFNWRWFLLLLLLSYINSVYILTMRPLPDILFMNILFQLVAYVFIFNGVFHEQKFLILMKSTLKIFSFMNFGSPLIFKKSLLTHPHIFLQHYLWRRLYFLIVCSWKLCWRSLGFTCKFISDLSVSLVYMSVLMPVPFCFHFGSFAEYFEIRRCDVSSFVLLAENY